MDSLELRRSVTRRETEVYLMGLLYVVLGVVAVWQTVALWVAVPELVQRGASDRILLTGGLVVTALTAVLLWWGTPMWQLALRPGRPEDVVVTLDGEGWC